VPRGGIFPRPETHLTSLGACGEAEPRLTWLSARCLSSCLFSAKFLSNKSQRAVRRRRVRTRASFLLSPK
jgi:hypothetical protein